MIPIISVRDNRNNRWKRNAKNKKQKRKKRTRGTKAIAKGWEINDFVERFKSGFLQLICKASLIFKSNLELLYERKERELYESKHDVVECRCLKIWDLLSFLICSSILVLKWRQARCYIDECQYSWNYS